MYIMEEKKTNFKKDLFRTIRTIKNNSKNTGITLIALIITIIILLILAGITIGELTGNGLFTNAQNAKEKYENSEVTENSILSEYESEIEKYEKKRTDGKYLVNINKDTNIKSVSGNGEYSPGDEVTVTAIIKDNYVDTDFTYNPATGETSPVENNEKYLYEHTYTFSGWTGSLTSSELSFTFTMPTYDVTLNANALETSNIKETYKYIVQTGTIPDYVNCYVESQDNMWANNFNLSRSTTSNTSYGCIFNFLTNTGIVEITNNNEGTSLIKINNVRYDVLAGETINVDVKEDGSSDWVKQ